MKKVVYFISILFVALLTSTSFAMDTKDVIGRWTGNLGGLTRVNLFVHTPDSMEDAEISFTDSSGTNVDYGMLLGNYQKNSDGTVTINFTRNSYGVQVNFSGRLTAPNKLVVDSFSYHDYMSNGSGSGLLQK